MKQPLLSVEEALTRLFALAAPLEAEAIPLEEAYGRLMAKPAISARAQPPFDASAMDGYAITNAAPKPGERYRVIGEAAAGHGFDGAIGPQDAVRIFTGAPLPKGAVHVVIQEDTAREGDVITLTERLESAAHIRTCGTDFAAETPFLSARPLGAAELGLLAAMNAAQIQVIRRPRLAILPTGDELVPLGGTPNAAQIINSNVYSLAALAREASAEVTILPIVRDDLGALQAAMQSAAQADVLLTIGGASVGDHDLIAPAAKAVGFALDFHKLALRPGKPLLLGHKGQQILLGLPGNPVSSFVCATLFLKPLLRRLGGGPAEGVRTLHLPLQGNLPANGPRDHYMRARYLPNGQVTPFERQDSSLQSVLAAADGLIRVPKHSPALSEGVLVDFIPLRPLDI